MEYNSVSILDIDRLILFFVIIIIIIIIIISTKIRYSGEVYSFWVLNQMARNTTTVFQTKHTLTLVRTFN